MTAAASVAAGLQGALLLARGRAEGLQRVEPGERGAVRSFWAMALCLPLFLLLRSLDWAVFGWPARPAHAVAVHVLAFATGWIGFLLLSHSLAAAQGRARRWPLFVAAWNWCSVVQYGLLLAASLPAVAGMPPWLVQAVALVGVGWALWLEWYATRLALDIGGLAAAGLVAVDVLVGVLVSGISDRLA